MLTLFKLITLFMLLIGLLTFYMKIAKFFLEVGTALMVVLILIVL